MEEKLFLEQIESVINKQKNLEKVTTRKIALDNLIFNKYEDNIIYFFVGSKLTKNIIEKNIKNELIKNIYNDLNIHCNIKIDVKSSKNKKNNELQTTKEKPILKEIKEKPILKEKLLFNKKYTFDSFIIDDDNNNFAYNACIAVTTKPGKLYNPLLIYGGVGLGKTHLIQAIGNQIVKENSNLKPIYVTAEEFTNDFIEYIGNKSNSKKYNNDFYNKYRKADVLLIDDIHTLQKKEQTQEELFHTFNTLFEAEKQLVFTCDRPISELKNITERLRNRFTRGLNVNLAPYKFETRLAILKSKVKKQKADISDDILEFIAQHVQTNVRDLESNLTKIIAYQNMFNKKIKKDDAYDLLGADFANKNVDKLSLDEIAKEISDYFNVSVYDMKSKNKSKSIKYARNCFIFLAKEYTDETLTDIGNFLNGRKHSSVYFVYSEITTKLKIEEKLKKDISLIKKNLNIIY